MNLSPISDDGLYLEVAELWLAAEPSSYFGQLTVAGRNRAGLKHLLHSCGDGTFCLTALRGRITVRLALLPETRPFKAFFRDPSYELLASKFSSNDRRQDVLLNDLRHRLPLPRERFKCIGAVLF